MKGFYYDTLLEAENICNLDREKEILLDGVLSGKKLVVYGPRNFGKTSLVKNVVIPAFRGKKKKSFVLFADLMEVKNLESIHQRICAGFEKSFTNSFPRQNLLNIAKRFLQNLRPQVTLDPVTGQPTLSLDVHVLSPERPFAEIFSVIGKKIAPEMPTLIVLDEFQDITFVPEAQGIFRQVLQEFKDISIILMGSKRHILSKIFSQPSAPLASFGEDVEFQPIPYEEYHQYILERFHQRKLNIHYDNAKTLQDALFRIPEAVNIVCAHLYAALHDETVDIDQVYWAIDKAVEGRTSRYESLLSLLSEKEEEVLKKIARQDVVRHPTGQEFLRTVHASQRSVKLIIDRFMDRSLLEKTENGYRISDPMLFYFLKKYRS